MFIVMRPVSWTRADLEHTKFMTPANKLQHFTANLLCNQCHICSFVKKSKIVVIIWFPEGFSSLQLQILSKGKELCLTSTNNAIRYTYG